MPHKDQFGAPSGNRRTNSSFPTLTGKGYSPLKINHGKESRSPHCWPTAIDLFSGSGSATAALKSAHFRVVAAVDNHPDSCATYRLNHPRVSLFESDIRTLDPRLLQARCLGKASLDLMIICAPCQPFSSQNRKRRRDGRARLLISAAQFVTILKPRIVFVENVPGLASCENIDLLQEFRQTCGTEYNFGEPTCVDAADYGVPQRRIRCLLMASRVGTAPSIPPPFTPEHARRTVREAIFDLASLASGESDPRDPLHAARAHQPIAIERLQAISKDGGSRIELPEHLELTCHRNHRGHPDVYGRMKWDDVAPTLTTGCTDVTRGRFAHPDANRAITVREAALLQTFPRNYRFCGSLKIIAEQIGNAIPYALVHAMTRTFRTSLREQR